MRGKMVRGQPQFLVTCMLVMGCGNLDRCRLAERLLLQRGFQSRSTAEGTTTCTRSLEREFAAGKADDLLDQACSDIELALIPNVGDWRAYVQVVGHESVWATLEAGEPTLRGSLAQPRPR